MNFWYVNGILTYNKGIEVVNSAPGFSGLYLESKLTLLQSASSLRSAQSLMLSQRDMRSIQTPSDF